ncbi:MULTISPECIES: LysR family transcriptional regulator [unclassified Rhizobium]|uniref:LysR family transcriptional regulator n=1 Tax=unclassified Rhizobium TaxID=2613769 RepID=UPI0038287A5B
MLDLNDFFYFVQVVDRGGFTAAGRTLRMPKSTLSHRIQQLEAELGVRLLNRTSRRFGMTDAGKSSTGTPSGCFNRRSRRKRRSATG